jgi:hypothetical protein
MALSNNKIGAIPPEACSSSWEEFERFLGRIHSAWRIAPPEEDSKSRILNSLDQAFLTLIQKTGIIRALAVLPVPMLYCRRRPETASIWPV